LRTRWQTKVCLYCFEFRSQNEPLVYTADQRHNISNCDRSNISTSTRTTCYTYSSSTCLIICGFSSIIRHGLQHVHGSNRKVFHLHKYLRYSYSNFIVKDNQQLYNSASTAHINTVTAVTDNLYSYQERRSPTYASVIGPVVPRQYWFSIR
jgi:hypothetical protein